MADWTLTKQTGAGTYLETIAAHATNAHEKGDYVELAASAGAAGFYLVFGWPSAANLQFLIDIATGGAGVESVVLANFYFSIGGGARDCAHIVYIPLRIAASSRISARCQCNVAAATIDLRLYTMSALNALPVYGRATTYGADTGDSGGTQVDPGGTVDTKGAYSPVSASLTNAIEYALLCFGNQSNSAETTGDFLIDVATGAEGVESVQQADLPLAVSAGIDAKTPVAWGFPIAIASSTRLAVRAQCSNNNATDRLFDVVVIGFDQQESSGGTGGGPLVGGRLAR